MILKNLSLFALLLFSLISPWSAYAGDKTIHLTSLEWPPYASEELPQQGAAIAIARAAFASMGYTLEVAFFPWSRAVAFSEDADNQYIGYLPEYYSSATAKKFIYSNAFAVGPLGFAERKDKSIPWSKLEELAPYRIGTVQDYINTEKFDEMVKNKSLITSSTLNDTNNLRKLVSGRIDLAIVDQHVMTYLLNNVTDLAANADQIQFNATPLEEKKLYICFNKTEEGYAMADIFNQGLKKIDVAAILAQHL
jgi:polar amino acid transport system substrate-binding protein